MAKIADRISAKEARNIANSTSTFLNHIYDDIRYQAQWNRLYTYYWLWGTQPKKEMLVDAIKNLVENGYKVELVKEDTKQYIEPVKLRTSDEIINNVLGLQKEEQEVEEDNNEQVEEYYNYLYISWE